MKISAMEQKKGKEVMQGSKNVLLQTNKSHPRSHGQLFRYIYEVHSYMVHGGGRL